MSVVTITIGNRTLVFIAGLLPVLKSHGNKKRSTLSGILNRKRNAQTQRVFAAFEKRVRRQQRRLGSLSIQPCCKTSKHAFHIASAAPWRIPNFKKLDAIKLLRHSAGVVFIIRRRRMC